MIKSIIKIILKVVEWEIFLVFLILIVVLILPILPVNLGISSFIIVSGSMEPTIHKGSITIVQKVNPSVLVTGNIMAFESPLNSKDTIVHRLVRTDESKFITKGDNNKTIDSWSLTASKIKGKVLM